MKTCRRCQTNKQESEFYPHSSQFGLRAHCKQCEIKSVRKWQKENPEKVRLWNNRWDKKNPEKIKISNYKASAKARGLTLELSEEHMCSLFHQSCFYCGQSTVALNGIDRVDSSIGYVVNNVVPCCTECNYGKSDRSQSEFENWIRRVYIHINKRGNDCA